MVDFCSLKAIARRPAFSCFSFCSVLGREVDTRVLRKARLFLHPDREASEEPMADQQQQYQGTETAEAQPPHDGDSGCGGEESEDEWAAPAKELESVAQNPKVAEVNIETLEGDERELAGDVVPVVFYVPANGEQFRRNYVMGHTIGHLKGQLEDLKGWPYERIILKLNGKLLIDPLSLNDLPFRAREDNVVEVTFTPQ